MLTNCETCGGEATERGCPGCLSEAIHLLRMSVIDEMNAVSWFIENEADSKTSVQAAMRWGDSLNRIYSPDGTQRAAQERTTLDEGSVLLTMPVNLGPDSVEEFEYWVNGIVRRIRRKAGLTKDSSQETEIQE